MLDWLRRIRGKTRAKAIQFVRFVRAKYDAAQTTDENRRHWANAAASAEVRRIVRNRARYEVANNSYARGIVLTLANDVVGTGPRLQMLTGDRELNTLLEKQFARWAASVNLAGQFGVHPNQITRDGCGAEYVTASRSR